MRHLIPKLQQTKPSQGACQTHQNNQPHTLLLDLIRGQDPALGTGSVTLTCHHISPPGEHVMKLTMNSSCVPRLQLSSISLLHAAHANCLLSRLRLWPTAPQQPGASSKQLGPSAVWSGHLVTSRIPADPRLGSSFFSSSPPATVNPLLAVL